MRKLSNQLTNQQSGFTLIELVIVIVIIGILAAVAIPQFASVTDDANAGLADGVVGGINSGLAAERALCANPSRAICKVRGLTCADLVIGEWMDKTPPGALIMSGCKVDYTPTGGTKVTSNVSVDSSLFLAAP